MRLAKYLLAIALGIAFTIALLSSLTGCDTAPVTDAPWLPVQPEASVEWDGGTVCAWGPLWVDCDDLGDAESD